MKSDRHINVVTGSYDKTLWHAHSRKKQNVHNRSMVLTLYKHSIYPMPLVAASMQLPRQRIEHVVRKYFKDV